MAIILRQRGVPCEVVGDPPVLTLDFGAIPLERHEEVRGFLREMFLPNLDSEDPFAKWVLSDAPTPFTTGGVL